MGKIATFPTAVTKATPVAKTTAKFVAPTTEAVYIETADDAVVISTTRPGTQEILRWKEPSAAVVTVTKSRLSTISPLLADYPASHSILQIGSLPKEPPQASTAINVASIAPLFEDTEPFVPEVETRTETSTAPTAATVSSISPLVEKSAPLVVSVEIPRGTLPVPPAAEVLSISPLVEVEDTEPFVATVESSTETPPTPTSASVSSTPLVEELAQPVISVLSPTKETLPVSSAANVSPVPPLVEESAPLVVAVESPAESALALLQASKALLKKLTMLAVVSDKGDLPGSLRKLFKDFEEDEEETSSQVTSRVPPVSTTPLPVVVAPVVTRARNFKHKKLASYYKTINGEEEGVDGDRGDGEVEESEVRYS